MRALRYLYQLMASLWFKTWYDECSKEFTYAYLISDLQTLNSYVWFHIIILFNCRFKWKRLSFFLFIYLFLRERSVIWILMYDCWSQKKGWREFEQRTNDLKEWWLGEKAGITLGEKKKKARGREMGFILSFLPLSLSLSPAAFVCRAGMCLLFISFFVSAPQALAGSVLCHSRVMANTETHSWPHQVYVRIWSFLAPHFHMNC